MGLIRTGLKPSGVYFLRCDDRVKIGASTRVPIRIRDLTYGVKQAELLGVLAVRNLWAAEEAMHRRFHTYRLRGEWYTAAPALLEEIRQLLTDPAIQLQWNGTSGPNYHIGRP